MRKLNVLILLAAALLHFAAVGRTATAAPFTFDLIDSAGRDINAVQNTSALTVDGPYLYAAYITGGLGLKVARRPLAGGAWTSTLVTSGVADDAHNGPGLGVDPQGYVWVGVDMHDAASLAGHIWRSVNPGDISAFAPAVPGGVLPASVSYPVFVRAGASFYLFFRAGLPGAGDVYVKQWSASGWSDLAAPLLSGLSVAPTDSAYLGQPQGLPSGDVLIAWTHRYDPANAGLSFARYNAASGAWQRADGTSYGLPITANSQEDRVLPLAETTVSNTGISVALDAAGRPHVAYAVNRGGAREVFHALFDGGAWRSVQVSRVHAPRLRACPTGPDTAEPRPCDMEVSGPTMLLSGNRVALLYARSTEVPRGTWARPAGILYAASSADGGYTWTAREVQELPEADPASHFPLSVSELPRETSGLPWVLLQETGGAGTGALYLAQATEELWTAGRLAGASVWDSTGTGAYAELPDSDCWSASGGGLTVSAWLKPAASGRSMGLVDKGGALPDRELRLLLWANNPGTGLVYDPGRLQVLLGNSSGGWGLLWYPAVVVPAGETSHLLLSWDGTTVSVYLNGALTAQTAYSGALRNGVANILVGADRSGAGLPERPFSGSLEVDLYAGVASAGQRASLFASGPGAF